MEKMPFQPHVEPRMQSIDSGWQPTTSDWRDRVPALVGSYFMLREVRLSDAPSLLAMLTAEEVSRFISPPPSTVAAFEQFIMWCQQQRAAGHYVCFAIVPSGSDHAVGLFQVRETEPRFATAEWGFAIGSQYWGTGMYPEAARLIVDFAFDVLRVHRLEARAAVQNGRGNGALRKIGAVQEGVLRRSLLKEGVYCDQILWSIIDEEWRQANADWRPSIH